MYKLRDTVNNELRQCEEFKESIENLLIGFEEFREKGGTAKLILYPRSRQIYETIIDEKIIEAFVKVLLTEYNDKLEEIKNDIIKTLDGEIRSNEISD